MTCQECRGEGCVRQAGPPATSSTCAACGGTGEQPRTRLRGALGTPPSLTGVASRVESGTLLTPRRELLVRR